jgi:hypothetical protein
MASKATFDLRSGGHFRADLDQSPLKSVGGN